MQDDWLPEETGTHQDHVIAHVIGATVLGYFIVDEAAHLLLDIGFIWNVYLDCEMGLVPQTMAIAELALDEAARSEVREDVSRLQTDEDDALLARIERAPAGCLIAEVAFASRGDERRLLITGEDASLAVETSLTSGEIRIHPL